MFDNMPRWSIVTQENRLLSSWSFCTAIANSRALVDRHQKCSCICVLILSCKIFTIYNNFPAVFVFHMIAIVFFFFLFMIFFSITLVRKREIKLKHRQKSIFFVILWSLLNSITRWRINRTMSLNVASTVKQK